MPRAFNFEFFYDFLEVIHELKFFLEGTAGIDPFNYLDSYVLIRRCADDGADSTEAERLLHHALCRTNTTHPVFHGARGGKTTEILEDVLSFVDALDDWRIQVSKFYGISPIIDDRRAFCLLCEMYCDENEPAYSMIYHQQKMKGDRQWHLKIQQQVKQDLQRLRDAHFSLPVSSRPSHQELSESIEEDRLRLDEWHQKNPHATSTSPLSQRNAMAQIMIEKNMLP